MKLKKYIENLSQLIQDHGLLYPNGDLTKLELCERIHYNHQGDFSNTFWSIIRYWYYDGKVVPSPVVTKIAGEEHDRMYDEVIKLLSGDIKTLQRKLKT